VQNLTKWSFTLVYAYLQVFLGLENFNYLKIGSTSELIIFIKTLDASIEENMKENF
jgi:hypothetical protein